MEWLAKDERRLLTGYLKNIRKANDSTAYKQIQLVRLLRRFCSIPPTIYEYGREPELKPKPFPSKPKWRWKIYLWYHGVMVRRYGRDEDRLSVAHDVLKNEKLINVIPHQHAHGVFCVSLTHEGFKLARKLSNPFGFAIIWGLCHKEVVAVVAGLCSIFGYLKISGGSKESAKDQPQTRASEPVVVPSAGPTPTVGNFYTGPDPTPTKPLGRHVDLGGIPIPAPAPTNFFLLRPVVTPSGTKPDYKMYDNDVLPKATPTPSASPSGTRLPPIKTNVE